MMIEEMIRQRVDLEAVKSAMGEMVTVGVVTEVDPARGYRIDLGEGTEGRLVSPWIPHPESGGQTASWVPLSKGQIVSILSPSGDLRQGVLLRSGFGGENAPPSQDLEANVLEAFGIRLQMKDGQLLIQCEDATIECSTAKIDASQSALVKSPKVDLGDKDGPRVARVGDMVRVTFGSSKGLHPIVQGSSKVFAAG
ncbi:MAG: hypothetical protein AAGI03_01610 [Pseudomonadota bacterium]